MLPCRPAVSKRVQTLFHHYRPTGEAPKYRNCDLFKPVGESVCRRVGLSASRSVGELVVGELVCRRVVS